ncbi:NAD(P)-binding protein [Tothia fuscella]|uniref:NAD(P)-binding protein n=1 Tax=Tothia fuscella TaxID=1048955 RepID=A0A9P4TT12_9PEZI|nr:NAD(P)-binding protein [Tothia fuscella]
MAPQSGRVAIVTGASSGMGQALARELVQRGWKVALADVQPNEALSKELGENAAYFKCDVSDYDSQAATFQGTWDKWGKIDALCANAGIVDRSSIYILEHRDSDKIPPKPNLATTDVDFKGVVYGTQLAIHFMRKNKTPGGKIVATASVAAIYSHSSYPEYNGAKAAVVQFIRGVAPVLKLKDNITANTILPGIVPTAIIPQAMIDAVKPEFLTPPSTIVAAYIRCLDDEEGKINGEAIECSGDQQFFVPSPEYVNGAASERACTVWDPLFKMMHGENSGLPEAIP